jgi:hypothetical protein
MKSHPIVDIGTAAGSGTGKIAKPAKSAAPPLGSSEAKVPTSTKPDGKAKSNSKPSK